MIRVVRIKEYVEVEFEDGDVRTFEMRSSDASFLRVADKEDFLVEYADAKGISANKEVDRRAAKMVQSAVLRLLGLNKGAEL